MERGRNSWLVLGGLRTFLWWVLVRKWRRLICGVYMVVVATVTVAVFPRIDRESCVDRGRRRGCKFVSFFSFFFFDDPRCPGQLTRTTTNPRTYWTSCKPSRQVKHRKDDRLVLLRIEPRTFVKASFIVNQWARPQVWLQVCFWFKGWLLLICMEFLWRSTAVSLLLEN